MISKEATHLLFPGIQDYDKHIAGGGNNYTAKFVNDATLQVCFKSSQVTPEEIPALLETIKPHEYTLWVDDNYVPYHNSAKDNYLKKDENVIIVAKNISAFLEAKDKLGPPKTLYLDHYLDAWHPIADGMDVLYWLDNSQPPVNKETFQLIPISSEKDCNKEMTTWCDENILGK